MCSIWVNLIISLRKWCWWSTYLTHFSSFTSLSRILKSYWSEKAVHLLNAFFHHDVPMKVPHLIRFKIWKENKSTQKKFQINDNLLCETQSIASCEFMIFLTQVNSTRRILHNRNFERDDALFSPLVISSCFFRQIRLIEIKRWEERETLKRMVRMGVKKWN